MELNHQNIEKYIQRFMEGETTNAEEQAIYRFFRTENVPEHLKPYAQMFAWYEEGMPDAQPARKKPLWKRLPIELWSMGIAAMLVIGIGLGVMLSLDNPRNDEWACYEGSYIETGGKRINDVKEIMPIILQTLAEADKAEMKVEERLAEIQRSEEAIAKQENELIND